MESLTQFLPKIKNQSNKHVSCSCAKMANPEASLGSRKTNFFIREEVSECEGWKVVLKSTVGLSGCQTGVLASWASLTLRKKQDIKEPGFLINLFIDYCKIANLKMIYVILSERVVGGGVVVTMAVPLCAMLRTELCSATVRTVSTTPVLLGPQHQ